MARERNTESNPQQPPRLFPHPVDFGVIFLWDGFKSPTQKAIARHKNMHKSIKGCPGMEIEKNQVAQKRRILFLCEYTRTQCFKNSIIWEHDHLGMVRV